MAARGNAALWTAALAGDDTLAAAALDRFCLALGAIGGDIALAQGGGGARGRAEAEARRPAAALGVADRFVAKGRFERRTGALPVKIITHPQPGLLGAAAAFAAAFPEAYGFPAPFLLRSP